MALMSFSKVGVPTFTFTRNDVFPRTPQVDTGQVIGESDGGAVWVTRVRPNIYLTALSWSGRTRLPETDYQGMLAFFLDPLVDEQANPFTWTDYDGTVRVMRLWEGLHTFVPVAAGLREGTLLLRQEVS